MHSNRMHTASSSSHLLGGLSQCMLGYTPQCGPRTPQVWAQGLPWVWAWRPPQPDPPPFPLGVDLARPLKPLSSPWLWAW